MCLNLHKNSNHFKRSQSYLHNHALVFLKQSSHCHILIIQTEKMTMKKTNLSCLALLSMSLSACSPMPKECAETWEKMESFAKSMGISDEQLKQQKKQFENEVKQMKSEEAVKICRMQGTALGFIGQ